MIVYKSTFTNVRVQYIGNTKVVAKREPSGIVLSDQTNTKARRFSHEEGYTGSSISSTGTYIPTEWTQRNRDSEPISYITEDSVQMAKEMGWDTGESGRSKPETKA